MVVNKRTIKRISKLSAVILILLFITLSLLPFENNSSIGIPSNITYFSSSSYTNNSVDMGQIASTFSIGGEISNYSNQLDSSRQGAMAIDLQNNCIYEASHDMLVQISIKNHSVNRLINNKQFGEGITWIGYDNSTNKIYMSVMTKTPSMGPGGFIGSILCMNPTNNYIRTMSSNMSCLGDSFQSYALNSHNNTLFYIQNISTIMEMNLTTATSTQMKLNFTPSNVCYLELSNNAKTLVFEEGLCKVVIENLSSGASILSPKLKGIVTDLAYDYIENRVFIKCQNTDNISVLNTTTGKIFHVINMSKSSYRMELNLPDQLLYVSPLDGNISVFNTTSLNYDGNINLPSFSLLKGSELCCVYDKKINELFLGYTVENQIIPINGMQVNDSGIIYIGSTVSEGIFYDKYNNMLYVSTNDGTLLWYNPQNFERVGKLYIGFYTKYFAVNPHSDLLYLSDTDSNSLYIFNTTSSAIVNDIGIGSAPVNVIYCSKTNDVYVLNKNSFNISVLTSSGKNIKSIPLLNGNLGNPVNMLYDSNNGNIYVSFEFPCDVQCVSISNLNTQKMFITNSENFIFDPITGNILVSKLQPWVPSTNTKSYPGGAYAGNHTYVSGESDPVNNNIVALKQNYLGESQSLVIINGSTEYLEGNVSIGNCIQDLTVDTSNGLIFASSANSNDLEIIKLFPEYEIKFVETGIISSPSWYINMIGRPQNYTISYSYESIYLPNGTYKFNVGTSEIYSASPQSGTIQVKGKSFEVSIAFSMEYNKLIENNYIYIIVFSAIIISAVIIIWRKRK